MSFAPGAEVFRQLEAAGCLPFIKDYVIGPHSVTGKCALRLVTEILRGSTSPFYEGWLHELHVDVGPNRVDWRARKGAYGVGSLQMVVDALGPQASGRFYADLDAHNPYQGAAPWLGHSWEVIAGWFRRKPTDSQHV